VCKIHESYCYSFKTVENSKDTLLLRNYEEKNHCFIAVHQKHLKLYQNQKKNYSLSRVIVFSIKDSRISLLI